jgi:heme o synthase
MINAYYYLAKPGIIYGNLITTTAGFMLASKGHINWPLFFATIIGISLIMASGCVFNNLLDRGIDQKMERTKNRALVVGTISKRSAIIYGTVLGLLGFATLCFHTNLLTLSIAVVGFIFYVGIYTPMKRRSVHGTLLGSIAGAVPPVVGYTAVTNHLDVGAILLFLILVTWQMPHFYAIAIRRLEEYKSASIPVLPVKKGVYVTKQFMMAYIVLFTIATLMLTVYGLTSYAYLIVMVIIGAYWLWSCFKGFWHPNDQVWARKLFFISLVNLMLWCVLVSVDAALKKGV